MRGGDSSSFVPRDIERLVTEALPKTGVQGEIRVEGDHVVLEARGQLTSVPLGLLAIEWATMSPEARRREALELTRRLTQKRRSLPPPAPPRPVVPGWVPWVGGLGLLGCAVLVAAPFVGRALTRPTPPPSASAVEDGERDARAVLACDRARLRVTQGATLGATDSEGWQVEVRLGRRGPIPLLNDPGLPAFFSPAREGATTRLVWASEELQAVQGPTTELRLERPDAAVGAAYDELVVVLRGEFVVRYFREESRPPFVELATVLSDRLGADYGALYARCRHSVAPYVGAWFRGRGAPGAAAALVYTMGAFADATHVRPELLADAAGEPRRQLALGLITERLPQLDRRELATLVAPAGGMVMGRDGQPMGIVFPFKDSNRATRASLHIAQRAGVGVRY